MLLSACGGAQLRAQRLPSLGAVCQLGPPNASKGNAVKHFLNVAIAVKDFLHRKMCGYTL